MKRLILVSMLVALCSASAARAQDVITSFGDTYRVASVNSTVILTPDASFATRKPDRALASDERLARSDAFVALALESQGLAGPGGVGLLRERVEERPENRSWVIYSQRHQGYPILGAGGRLELDSYGRVIYAGLSYESERLRNFQPLGGAALEKLAESAVPHPREGPAVGQELMIDPRGDAPAELRAYFLYQVKHNDRTEPWQVTLNAETGEVIDSFSRLLHAEAREAVDPLLDPADPPRHPPVEGRPRPEALDKARPAAGPVEPVPNVSPTAYPDPLTVYVDLYGDCGSLQIQYINEYNGVETRIVTYNDVLFVYPNTSMTVSDATAAATTCQRVFELNYDPYGLPHTFAVMDFDVISLDSDCRPSVRTSEGTSTICFNRDLSTTRIDTWRLTTSPTLSEGAILNVARQSNPNDFLPVPCQVFQTPPNSVTIQDNTRFDEVNAFYQAKEFSERYLWWQLGISLTSGYRIRTKVPVGDSDPTSFDLWSRVLYLGAGDAYGNPFPGTHVYDASKFASVIQHEVTHALTGQLYGTYSPSTEADAIDEGIADYAAASFNNNPAVGLCYLTNYDHIRSVDNLASDFRYSRIDVCQYPVSSGATARAGTPHAQGLIAAGLLWDMRRTIGASAADAILGDALRGRTTRPDYAQLGAAILASAIARGFECQVRPLLVAREFPGITPGGASPPTALTVNTVMPDRCKISASWSGSAPFYKVTWQTDGGSEQTLAASQSPRTWSGSVGTINGGTLRVYSIYCGTINPTPASGRRETVIETSRSPAIRATNRLNASGQTETYVDWDALPGTPNWRLLRNGIAWGNDLPGSTLSKVDPAGCGGTFTYCVQVVDCGGSHGVSPACPTVTRPGLPLAVTMSGPTSLPYNTSGTFTASVTGGCGVARYDWYWMYECSGGGDGGGGPYEEPIVYDPTTTGATPDRGARGADPSAVASPPNEINLPPCGTWYRYSLDPLTSSIVRGFSYGTYWNLRVTVTDLAGATATATKRIQVGSAMTYTPDGTLGLTEAARELPMKLEWDGSSIALVNVNGSSEGVARLQIFDVAGRRRAEVLTPLAGSSRIEFPVARDLARGVYFAKVEVPGRAAFRKTIVLK